MTRTILPLPVAVLLLVTSAAGTAWAQQPTGGPDSALSTLRGVYSDAQAVRGESTYRANCTSCHATSAYTGAPFARAWGGRTAFDLFELIRTTMPNDNPGRLSRSEYAEIVAYLFKLNGFPPGEQALPNDDDGLKRIRIEAKAPAP